MKNKVNQYKKEDDIYVESIGPQEALVMNPQKSRVTLRDGFGRIERQYDQLIIVFSAVDFYNPCPAEDGEPIAFDPNDPLIIEIERKESVDHLIATLQRIRTQIWGINLDLENSKN